MRLLIPEGEGQCVTNDEIRLSLRSLTANHRAILPGTFISMFDQDWSSSSQQDITQKWRPSLYKDA